MRYKSIFFFTNNCLPARRMPLAALALILMPILGAPEPTQAMQTKAVTFPSCSKLNSLYPSGIALSSAAAKAATRRGFLKPQINSSLYGANKKKLDSKHFGYICASKGEAPLANFQAITQWGYVKAQEAYVPGPNGCVTVNAQIDIRNANLFPSTGVEIGIFSAFQNVVGFAELGTVQRPAPNLSNGVYPLPMTVCDHDSFSGYGSLRLDPWAPGTIYMLQVADFDSQDILATSIFSFRRA